MCYSNPFQADRSQCFLHQFRVYFRTSFSRGVLLNFWIKTALAPPEAGPQAGLLSHDTLSSGQGEFPRNMEKSRTGISFMNRLL